MLVAYVVAPLFALPNSYGCGLTDWDMASMYGKLCLFIFAAWAGAEVRPARGRAPRLVRHPRMPTVHRSTAGGPGPKPSLSDTPQNGRPRRRATV